MASLWKNAPEFLPDDHDEVWCDRGFDFGKPFLATWHADTQQFISTDNSLTIPWYAVNRWRPK